MEQRATFLLGHLRANGADQTAIDELAAILRQLADTNTAQGVALNDLRATLRERERALEIWRAELAAMQETYNRVPCVRFGNWLSRIFRRN